MHLQQRILRFLFIIPVLLFFSGCPGDRSTTLVLTTDRPEMAVVAEMFNAEQDEYKIELVLHTRPARGTDYDIIFSEYLPSVALIDQFLPLDDLFSKGYIDKNQFYTDSLQAGIFEEKQVLLPVSFTIPAVLLLSGAVPDETGGSQISLSTLLEESRLYNETSTTRFPARGFSPLWSTEFLYLITRLHNTNFRESSEGSLVWNNMNLERSLEYIRDWVYTMNGGLEEENRFKETYLYDPGYKLVYSGRIRFYPVEYQKFLLIPADIQRNVDFRWVSDGTRIPVHENMVYAGVVRKPGNRKAAIAFMSWFFQESTQEKILESLQFKRIRSFGVAGGFSSIRRVNELILPKYYPGIAGRVPAPGQLSFPPALPANWYRIKSEVVIPFINETILSTGSVESLDQRLLTWYSQQAK